MTDLTNAELSDFLFNAIAHGDEKHRQWLRDKCNELAPQIAARRLAAPESADEREELVVIIARYDTRAPMVSNERLADLIFAAGYRKRTAQPEAGVVSESVYLSAVQGRRDFRNAYDRMLKACREARGRLEKGRALWNGPCHETASVLDEALNGPQPDSQSEPDAVQTFAAELVEWLRYDRTRTELLEHIRSMAEGRHEK